MISSDEDKKANEAIERWESINKAGNTLCNDAERTLMKMYGCDLGGEKDSSLDGFNVREYLELLGKAYKPIIFELGWDRSGQQYFCGAFRVDKRTSIALKKCVDSLENQKYIKRYTKNKKSIELVNSRIADLEKLIETMISRIRDDYDKFNQA